jgi:hypothetical protein
MTQIDLEKFAVNGKRKYDFIPGLDSGLFAFYLNDTLHLGLVNCSKSLYFDSTNGKGDVSRIRHDLLNKQFKVKNIKYALKIAHNDFLDLMEEDHQLFLSSLDIQDPLKNIVGEKIKHYFKEIYSTIKNGLENRYANFTTPLINNLRNSAQTKYFILENAIIHNFNANNSQNFDLISIITAEPTSNDALRASIEQGYIHEIGVQPNHKLHIHELSDNLATPEFIHIMKENPYLVLNNFNSIHAAMPNSSSKHRHRADDPLQYSFDFK